MNVHDYLMSIIKRGGDRKQYSRHPMTKARLGKLFKEGRLYQMVKLNSEVVESGDNVECNKIYQIINVEEVTTEVSFYQGIRVEMTSVDGEDGSIMLWQRNKVGTASKLGSFIALLGNDTDKWKGQFVVFQKWEKGARTIILANIPKVVKEIASLGGNVVKGKKKAEPLK